MPTVLLFLGLTFLGTVDVIYIKHSHIVISALGAFATQGVDEFNLSLPYSLAVSYIAVLIPVVLLAIRGTEFCGGRLSAVSALSIMAPACRMVASHSAILGISFADRTWPGSEIIAAVLTLFCDRLLIVHRNNYTMNFYYAIAERRIREAQMQTHLPGF